MHNTIDMINKKYGRLTVIKYEYSDNNGRRYLCKCDCGKEISANGGHIRNGHIQSCGCLKRDNGAARFKRKYNDPREISARVIWRASYKDGCSWKKFMELSQKNCHYCNSPPSNLYNAFITKEGVYKPNVDKEWADKGTFKYSGFDKIDQNSDHSEENILPSCYLCNKVKNIYNFTDFKNG